MNFDYNDIKLPEGGKFKISPSSISTFFDMPTVWYEENILKDKKFQGTTATVLGTIIHALAEAYAKGETTSKEECEVYITKMALEIPELNEENPTTGLTGVATIQMLYADMAAVLINEYISSNMPDGIETEVCAHIENGVYVAGSLDHRAGSMVVDYKNVSKKPNTETIPFGYLIQMMAYAYADRANGIFTDRIRLVYTVRPTKTLGIRLFTVTKQINEDDWKLIEDTLALIADTVQLHWAMPELDYITFKSMRFKQDV